MTNRAELRDLAIDAIISSGCIAQNNVFQYAWPSNLDVNPAVLVNWGREVKISNGREVPNFTTTYTMRLDVKVTDTTMAESNRKLDVLVGQVMRAVLTDYELNKKLQQFPVVEATNITDSNSEFFIAEAIIDIGMEYFEIYNPCIETELETVTIDVDLKNIYDAVATYPDPLFPNSVVPAPRTTGPDGRAEGYLEINNLNE